MEREQRNFESYLYHILRVSKPIEVIYASIGRLFLFQSENGYLLYRVIIPVRRFIIGYAPMIMCNVFCFEFLALFST